ncbi:unnamed protein product [Rhizophagus irregularis]|uniref:Uncharacterized protein n=1 Tax=Rhizophagus irregularis TaxID=588596 RepID=A0A2I1H6E9_9GLOM|nr:hypothetical protein RhiirA4_473284 [Rhizophagus irregularis]CAB4409582.1 unnamed protein product [Rhizophagus irregularis]
MSDKTEVLNKTKTPDKLEKFLANGDIILNCFISDEEVNDIFKVTISNANDNQVSSLANEIMKRESMLSYPPTETVLEVLSKDN